MGSGLSETEVTLTGSNAKKSEIFRHNRPTGWLNVGPNGPYLVRVYRARMPW